MSLTFKPARRENVPLLIGLAGPSGSGKTLSALLLAKGLSAGKPFALVDTERGRALHYADSFDFLHAELEAPFSPARYGEAIAEAEKIGPSVIVIDSFSHEHAGEGGVLDMHEAELDRLAGQDYKKRETMKFAAWIKPKQEHKRLLQELLQLRTHLIVCLRAEEKIDLVKNPQTGKLEVKPMKTLAGHVGWIPVCGKDLPYELTLSLVVTPDHPGVPTPIKLQEQHRPLVSLERPLDEETGKRLGEWARGGAVGRTESAVTGAGASPSAEQPTDRSEASAASAAGERARSPSEPLSKTEFARLLDTFAVPRERVRAVGHELFPGKAAAALTNAERGQLWAALQPEGAAA